MNYLLISHLTLRRAIGVLGMALPFVLPALGGAQDSLSAYYGTPARDVLVGVLCTMGAFLLAYNGYTKRDRIASGVQGLAIIGVAWLPWNGAHATLHLVCAGIFFAIASATCLLLFTKTSGDLTPRKLHRNRVYRLCGWVIVACLVAAAAGAPLLLIEAVAVFAFGGAWLVKGEAILADQVGA